MVPRPQRHNTDKNKLGTASEQLISIPIFLWALFTMPMDTKALLLGLIIGLLIGIIIGFLIEYTFLF